MHTAATKIPAIPSDWRELNAIAANNLDHLSNGCASGTFIQPAINEFIIITEALVHFGVGLVGPIEPADSKDCESHECAVTKHAISHILLILVLNSATGPWC
jgi:hypothetical protein